MAELKEIDLRTLLEDTRQRHAGIVALIHQTDAQALGLMRLYVTLAVATASGAAAVIGGQLFSGALGLALLSMTFVLMTGTWFCLRALQGGAISVPGRTPDYWQWALRADVDLNLVVDAYLTNLATKIEANRALNVRTTTALTWAKRCGIAAPFLGLCAATGWTTSRLL